MISIDVDYEVADEVTKKSLLQSIEWLHEDYKLALFEEKGRVFSLDWKEDRKQIKKMLKSLIRVYNWYVGPNDNLETKNYV